MSNMEFEPPAPLPKSLSILAGMEVVSFDELYETLLYYASTASSVHSGLVNSLIEKIQPTQEELVKLANEAQRGLSELEINQNNDPPGKIARERAQYQGIIDYIDSLLIQTPNE